MTPEQELELLALKETLMACYANLGPWVKYCQEKFPGEDPVEKAKAHLLKLVTAVASTSPGEAKAAAAVLGDPIYCYKQYLTCMNMVPRPPDCYARYLQCLSTLMPQ